MTMEEEMPALPYNNMETKSPLPLDAKSPVPLDTAIETNRTSSSDAGVLSGSIDGREYRQGQRIILNGIPGLHGQEAVVTALGSRKRHGQLYVRCAGKSMRISASNASIHPDQLNEEDLPSNRSGEGNTMKRGTVVTLTGLNDYEDAEAVVTGVGKGGKKLWVVVEKKIICVWAENVVFKAAPPPPLSALPALSPAKAGESTSDTNRTNSSTSSRGHGFKQGHRIILHGLSGLEEGAEGIITAVGTGKRDGQLYIRSNNRTMRIDAVSATLHPMQLADAPEESNRSNEAEGYTKGSCVVLTGLQGLEGKEAIITGMSKDLKTLWVVCEARYMRIWTENAIVRDASGAPTQPPPSSPPSVVRLGGKGASPPSLPLAVGASTTPPNPIVQEV